MNRPSIHFQILDGFDDPLVGARLWNELLRAGSTDVVFLTHQYQKAWWETFGRGQLMLIAACRDVVPFAIAPFFADGNMVFFVGSGGSDYLDFIGCVDDALIIEGFLRTAEAQIDGCLGFRFYHVPANSGTHGLLSAIRVHHLWDICEEGESPCPLLAISEFPEQAKAAAQKKSLRRHQAWFEKNGGINMQHLRESAEILPFLDAFFDQHEERWAATRYPSLFTEPSQRRFFRRLCNDLSIRGWLRFTRIGWKGQAIAFHFGFSYHGRFLWYKPSFDIGLAKYGPGEVLIRQLLLHAIEEGAHTFDLGLGDEAFKERFATNTVFVKNIGAYPQITAHVEK